MKAKKFTGFLSGNTCRLKAILLIVALLGVIPLKSQNRPPVQFFPKFGISAGYFNPEAVNNFIKNDLSSHNIVNSTNTDIFLYFEGHGGLTLKIKWIEINGFLEYATAPKVVIVLNGDTRSYYFNRFTYGTTVNFHIPMGLSKNAIFIGGGVHNNNMTFESYSVTTPGFRIQAGVSLQLGWFNLQPYLSYNNVAGTAPGNFDMNYTGGQIGLVFSFHR
jgi:hypothetical protein